MTAAASGSSHRVGLVSTGATGVSGGYMTVHAISVAVKTEGARRISCERASTVAKVAKPATTISNAPTRMRASDRGTVLPADADSCPGAGLDGTRVFG